ncbi:hypothetical protein [Ralstonia solanacearum]|nr:hypothetical protein [Ralstonia solanacearum]
MRQAATHFEHDHSALVHEFTELVAQLSDDECARLIRLFEQKQTKAVAVD